MKGEASNTGCSGLQRMPHKHIHLGAGHPALPGGEQEKGSMCAVGSR